MVGTVQFTVGSNLEFRPDGHAILPVGGGFSASPDVYRAMGWKSVPEAVEVAGITVGNLPPGALVRLTLLQNVPGYVCELFFNGVLS